MAPRLTLADNFFSDTMDAIKGLAIAGSRPTATTTSDVANVLGFMADKINLSLDAAKVYRVADEAAPGFKFVSHAALGMGALLDGYSMYSSASQGNIPLSGMAGLGGLLGAFAVGGGPPGLIVGGLGAAGSFLIPDPSFRLDMSFMNNPGTPYLNLLGN